MKNGIASSAKLSMPVAMLCATAVKAGMPPIARKASIAAIPMQNATGTLSNSRIEEADDQNQNGQIHGHSLQNVEVLWSVRSMLRHLTLCLRFTTASDS